MSKTQVLAGIALLALGVGLGFWLQQNEGMDGQEAVAPTVKQAGQEKPVLYWVAPMDPNYRRDTPGKSPMGMDLVPVYAGQDSEGVRIDPAMVQNLGVRTEAVSRGPLWRRISTVGYVDFDERSISHVHLRTDGWVETLRVKSNGEQVARGEVLLELYSRELVNAQEEYLQALRMNNDSLRAASQERLQSLGMSDGQIREITTSRKVAQRVRILAEQDGIVADLNIREGMYVKPDMELMTLADLSSVWLLVDVFERQSEWVHKGMPAEVELPYLPGRIWEGKVSFIYPAIDPKTRTLRVRLQFDNPDGLLKPDMYAKVRIFAGPKREVLSIPREALIRTGEHERVVVALGDGHFAARGVVAGLESGDWIEIISGLQEGERVVTSGQFLIDSEASLHASFTRMDSTDATKPAAPAAQTITGMGTVNEVFAISHKLNMTHQPIAALGWPAMTMDFRVDEAVDLAGLQAGQRLHFELVKDADGTRIVAIHVLPEGETP